VEHEEAGRLSHRPGERASARDHRRIISRCLGAARDEDRMSEQVHELGRDAAAPTGARATRPRADDHEVGLRSPGLPSDGVAGIDQSRENSGGAPDIDVSSSDLNMRCAGFAGSVASCCGSAYFDRKPSVLRPRDVSDLPKRLCRQQRLLCGSVRAMGTRPCPSRTLRAALGRRPAPACAKSCADKEPERADATNSVAGSQTCPSASICSVAKVEPPRTACSANCA
jgi:hypothetical protein